MAIQVSGTTVIDNDRNVTNTSSITASGAVEGASLTDGTATLSGGNLSGAGNLTATGAVESASMLATSYRENHQALSGTSPTLDCSAANVFSISTTGTTTFSFSNVPASGTAFGITVEIYAGGNHTHNWPSSVKWAGGTQPDAPASGETDIIGLFTRNGGTTWYGFLAGDAMS